MDPEELLYTQLKRQERLSHTGGQEYTMGIRENVLNAYKWQDACYSSISPIGLVAATMTLITVDHDYCYYWMNQPIIEKVNNYASYYYYYY